MGIEVIGNKNDLFGVRIAVVNQLPHEYCPIGLCSPLRNRDGFFSDDRFDGKKNVGSSRNFVETQTEPRIMLGYLNASSLENRLFFSEPFGVYLQQK